MSESSPTPGGRGRPPQPTPLPMGGPRHARNAPAGDTAQFPVRRPEPAADAGQQPSLLQQRLQGAFLTAIGVAGLFGGVLFSIEAPRFTPVPVVFLSFWLVMVIVGKILFTGLGKLRETGISAAPAPSQVRAAAAVAGIVVAVGMMGFATTTGGAGVASAAPCPGGGPATCGPTGPELTFSPPTQGGQQGGQQTGGPQTGGQQGIATSPSPVGSGGDNGPGIQAQTPQFGTPGQQAPNIPGNEPQGAPAGPGSGSTGQGAAPGAGADTAGSGPVTAAPPPVASPVPEPPAAVSAVTPAAPAPNTGPPGPGSTVDANARESIPQAPSTNTGSADAQDRRGEDSVPSWAYLVNEAVAVMTGRRLVRPSSSAGGPAVTGALPPAGATPAAPPSPAPGPLPEGSAPLLPVAGGRRRNDDDESSDEDSDTRTDLSWVPIPAGTPPRAMDVPLIRPPGLPSTPGPRTSQDLTVVSADAPHSAQLTVLHGLLRSVQVDPATGELRIVDNRTGDTVLAVAPPIGRDAGGREVPSEFTVAPNGDGTSTLTQTLHADPQTVSYPLTVPAASGGLSPQWAAAAAILGYRFKDLNPARLGEFVLQAGEQILPVSGVRNLAALTADEVARGTAHPPSNRDPKMTPDAKEKWLQEKATASRPVLERAQLTDPNLFRRLAEAAGLDPDAPGTTVTRVASKLAEAEWGRNSLVPTHAPDRAFSGRDVIDTATSPLRTSPLRSSIANLLPDLRPEQVHIVGPLDDILAERSGVPLTGESRTNSTLGGSAKHQSPNVSAVRQLAQDMVNSGRGAETLDGKISTLVQRPDGTATLIGPDTPEAQRAAGQAGVKITEHATDTANPPKPYNPGRTPTVTAPTPAPTAASTAEAVRPTVAGRAAPVLRGLGKASPLLFPAAVILDVNQGKTAGQAIVTNGTSAVLGGGASYALFLAGASGFPLLLVGVGVGVVGYEVGNYVWNDVLSQSQRDAISSTISKADWGPVDPATTKAGWSTNGYPGSATKPAPRSAAPALPATAIPLQIGPNGQVIPQLSAPTAPIVTRGPDVNSSQTRSGNDTTADRTQSPNGRVDPQGPTASINKPGSITARRSGNDIASARAEAAARARAQEQAAAAQAAQTPSRPPIAPSTDPEGRSKPASGKAADLDEM